MLVKSKTKSLYNSWKIQVRVIGALLLREIITRFGRHNIGFLWLFTEPMMFTLGITVLWTLSKANHGSNLPITAFAITGYSSILLWRNTVGRCNQAITPNLGLMYHNNVKVLDIYISRIIIEISGSTISFVILSSIFIYLGLMDFPADVVTTIFGWLLLTWVGASLGLLIGSLSEQSDIVEKLWHPISYLMFPLSGAAFMVDWLPPTAQKIVLFLPMVHGIELLREGYFGNLVKAHYNLSYAITICLIMTMFGLIFAKQTENRVEPE